MTTLIVRPRGRSQGRTRAETLDLHEFRQGGGAAMAMHNTQQRIEGFARASFNHAPQRRRPLYVSTKNTVRKAYNGSSMFMDICRRICEAE
jgi:isocitrate dehydrogenase